jgi:hypothetical protein
MKVGGIDLVAGPTARMKGWQTRTFPGQVCIHRRKMGTAKQNRLMVTFRGGRGVHVGAAPVWEFLRSFYQMSKKPLS